MTNLRPHLSSEDSLPDHFDPDELRDSSHHGQQQTVNVMHSPSVDAAFQHSKSIEMGDVSVDKV
jgi:hypothetical protein